MYRLFCINKAFSNENVCAVHGFLLTLYPKRACDTYYQVFKVQIINNLNSFYVVN